MSGNLDRPPQQPEDYATIEVEDLRFATEATLLRWLKEEGEFVWAGEPLYLLEEGDGAAYSENDSPATGVLYRKFKLRGDKVREGTLLGLIANPLD